ncbi:MAG: S8 family serine peptidase [Wenzhouxiangellaceae bacterium]
MRALVALLIGLLTTGHLSAAGILDVDDPIPNKYIVILKDSLFAPQELAVAAERRHDIQRVADEVTHRIGGVRGQMFSEVMTGFSVRIDRRGAERLSRDPDVALVAEDSRVHALASHDQPEPPSWGLDRLDQHDPELDYLYSWYVADSLHDVHVYVMDSGIRSTHVDFGGRVDTFESFSTIQDGFGVEDCHGHGTHVAGIIGGMDHGVSKDVRIHPVRVLDCDGRGSVSSLIAAIEWVTNRVMENPHPAVVNFSLGTQGSSILDNAVQTSIAAGIVYVAAAGNSSDDACAYSPARVPEVITVGATDIDDSRAAFSSFGECVDIYAPGRGITSTFNRSDTDTLKMSGTSMAAPHVAGIAINLLAQKPLSSPSEIMEHILSSAGSFKNDVDSNGIGKLAYSLIDISTDPVVFSDNWESR